MIIMPLLVGFIIQSFLSHWRHHAVATPDIKFDNASADSESEESSDDEGQSRCELYVCLWRISANVQRRSCST